MVQAGSGLKPKRSVTEARRDVRLAREALLKAQEQHREAQERLESELRRGGDDLTKEGLLQTVKDEVETKKKVEAQQQEVVQMQDTLRTVMKKFFSGGLAGVIARSSVAPIDRVKILQQTAGAIKDGSAAEYADMGIPQAMKMIHQKEGMSGFWRGNLTNCVRVFPHAATQFAAYDYFKSLFAQNSGSPESYLSKVACGGLAGAAAVTVTHPMDLVRIRLQTQPELKGVADAIKGIIRANGPLGFYRGYTSAVLSLSPFIAVNFTTFDTIKTLYFGPQAKLSKKQIKEQNPLLNLGFGAASGLVAQTVCYPLDTVRRRMAVAGSTYTGNLNAVATIVKEEGIGGFYRGMMANALKVMPNNAIRFAAFEFIKNYLL